MEVITKNILRLSSPSGLPPCQWKSSLRTFYVVITIWFTPMSVEVITKNILRLSSPSGLPPSQWKSSLRTLYGRHNNLVYPYEMSIHQIIMKPFWFTEILSSLFYRHYFQRRNCLPFENTWVHSSPVFDGVRFTHLFACSWLVHQCYLCLVISPAPQF
jgi:hypothetical protein